MWRSPILALVVVHAIIIISTPTLCTHVVSTPPKYIGFEIPVHKQLDLPRITNEDNTPFRPFDRDDDCVSCFAHIEVLQKTIQALKRNIIETVSDASLRERLLDIRPQFKDTHVPDQPDQPQTTSASPYNRHRRTESSNERCLQYPHYLQPQGPCNICGGNGSRSAICEGKCLQEATSACSGIYSDYFENNQECVTSMICIDCSVISGVTNPIKQVPCPPDDYAGANTSKVILLLDNNHDLNLTGAFGPAGVYENELAAVSLSNTTLNGTQLNFANMVIYGTFNMSSSTILEGITHSAFSLVTVYNDFDMSSAVVDQISDRAFSQATIRGNFDMSSSTVLDGITTLAFYGVNVEKVFNMSSATILGGIGRKVEFSVFGSARIGFVFDMSSANITGGIAKAFQGVIITEHFDMHSATISGGITQFAFANSIVGGDFMLFNTTFKGDVGIQAGTFAGATVNGVLDASGARFPNDTLPAQMLYGLQVNGVDFSYCNLKVLTVKTCNGSCGSIIRTALQNDDIINPTQISQLEGGPFTGMAMPVAVSTITVDLSHNKLVEIKTTSLLGIAASTIDLSYNQITVFYPDWFQSIPNTQQINTIGNPSTCTRQQQNSLYERYTYTGESASFVCRCGGGTNGTGNFCAYFNCAQSLQALNVHAQMSMGAVGYVSSTCGTNATCSVPSLGNVTLNCPPRTHPNNASAVVATCLGGAFTAQANQCVEDPLLTADGIIGVVVGVLFIGAILAYFVLLYPERRKRKRLTNKLTFTNNEVELKEHLLLASNCSLKEATVRNSRMLGAWKIDVEDVNFGDEIASGGFGDVYKGEFGGLSVAVKVLKTPIDGMLHPDVGNDFARECETLMAIRHTCLLIFYGAGLTSDNRPFMVTELMLRGSLMNVLADETQELPWALRQKFALQIAKAMKYLHQLGVVHRDLKSDNCLVNDQLDVKVCDFGTSKFLTAGQSTFEHSTLDFETMGSDSSAAFSTTMTKGVGTVLWMAPELFVGGTKYKQEVDLYSYGMIMWELITRKVPWTEIKETEYLRFFAALNLAMKNNQRPRIPEEAIVSHPEFVLLMQKCWATNPESRPTFEQVIQALV